MYVLGAVCTREPISMVSNEDLRPLDPAFESMELKVW